MLQLAFFRYMYRPTPDVSVLPNLQGATLEIRHLVNQILVSSPLQKHQDHYLKKTILRDLPQFDLDLWGFQFLLNRVFQKIERA